MTIGKIINKNQQNSRGITPCVTTSGPCCLTISLHRLTASGPPQYAFSNNQVNKTGKGPARRLLLPVQLWEPGPSKGSYEPHPGIRPKARLMKSEESCKPVTLLCVLLMAGSLFWGRGAQGVLAPTSQGSALSTCQETSAYNESRGHIRRTSLERKRHTRFRKSRTRHRARARHVYARAAFRHQHRGRHFVRKGQVPRILSARSGLARFRKPRIAQGAKPPTGQSLARAAEAKRPLVGKIPATSGPVQTLNLIPWTAPAPLAGKIPATSAPVEVLNLIPRAAPAPLITAPLIAVSSDGRISASIQNRPLQETLRLMSERHLFEVRGSVPTGAPVTMQFSDLTLEQVFDRIMRGYNYALITEETSNKRVLIVLGEAKRFAYVEPASPAQTPRQGERTAEQTTGQVPDANTAPPSGPALLQQLRARTSAAKPVSPAGVPQTTNAPPAPGPEQIGLEQQDTGKQVPTAGPGAAGIPPKTENGASVPEQQPSERSPSGSF